MSYQITRALLVHPSFTGMITPFLTEYVHQTVKEESCLSLNIYRHQSDPSLYVLHGTWTNEIAYLYHIDQQHYKHFLYMTSAMLMPPSAYPLLSMVNI